MTFFQDYLALKAKTPHIGIRGYKNTNCNFDDYLYFSKNCYMCFTADKFWDCFYCYEGCDLKDCCDSSECDRCELCYSCLNCRDCVDGTWLQDCRRVSQSSFCYDCVGCNSCFGCVGLRQKTYCLFNEQFSEEEYKKQMAAWKAKGGAAIWEKFEKLKLEIPRQHAMIYRGEDSTGNHLENVQNAISCFSSSKLQDCMHCDRLYAVYGDRNRDTMEVSGSVDLEMCYEVQWVGKGNNCSFCHYCEVVRDCDYCFSVFNSKNCFGCVSVNHGEFMILNEKYSEEDYLKKKAEIIEQMKKDGEWGKWMIPEGERIDC
jgi:hypothetical protein